MVQVVVSVEFCICGLARGMQTSKIINFEPIPHRKAPKPGFWLKFLGFKWTRRARRIHLDRVSAQTEPRRPISSPKQSLLCKRFQLGSSRELGNVLSGFQDCFRTTQRVLGAHIYLVFASNRAMATCFVTKTFPRWS